MNKAKLGKLLKAMPFVVAPSTRKSVELLDALTSWNKCHPYLRDMAPTEGSLESVGEMIYLELHREDGARPWMVDRLYMRYSNLRRQYEGYLLSTINATVMHAEAA